ncbi:MAG TPA: peptidase M24 [Lachnospiraceae bacterium]|uniref:M23 family metallopeptidase n=1 Tax=Anaerosporobacter sp. TaxID=1872529 RepID=UPI000ED92254|nr:M23 family metallopeptidase [Anaerosporobacter sp.]HAB60423.1 peptidase M24 [Lachnospiraceae bacterium]
MLTTRSYGDKKDMNSIMKKRRSIKSRLIIGMLGSIVLIMVLCVYGIGGMVGAYVWTIGVFIVAPITCVGAVIQICRIMKKIVWYAAKRKDSDKKQDIRICTDLIILVLILVLAYPITILFGVSALTYPRNADQADCVSMKMPVENAVLFGGKEFKSHAIWPSECYAYDIVVEPYDTNSGRLENYGIYMADVIAPVSGTVIGMENTEEDIMPNTEEFKSSLGNYIFLKIEQTGTYLILAHLEKGSIPVSIDDYVEVGQYIGKVGNSGTTSEPHLHIQHQRNNPLTMIFPTCSEGLPIEFQ